MALHNSQGYAVSSAVAQPVAVFPQLMGMLIVTLSFKFQESRYVVYKQRQLSARATILAMMEHGLEMMDIGQELSHVFGVSLFVEAVTQETSAKISTEKKTPC